MSPPPHQLVEELDLQGARQAVLRYQPAKNWMSVSRDPTKRMTIGFGFDVNRSDASELMRRVGLDPSAARAGRVPISDAQMNELFDLSLDAAVGVARDRVPGFAKMTPERQSALLELIVWLGPYRSHEIFNELDRLSLPLTGEPLAPSPWLDIIPGSASPRHHTHPPEAIPGARRTTTFESFGVVAELVSDDAELLAGARSMLPPGWREVDDLPTAEFGLWSDGIITVDGAPVYRAEERAASLLKLGAIVRHHVASEAAAFTFVHAGVVEAHGCGIVIPGRSYSGKSTLVAELVRLGATYVSDEYAVVDCAGLIQPFAKPLSIRGNAEQPLDRLVPAPEAQVARHPVRCGLIVLTSYNPEAQWRPASRSRAEGGFALLQNAVSARRRPALALRETTRLAQGATVLAGPRGEADKTAPALLELALLQAAR
jgi:hypothetical protein